MRVHRDIVACNGCIPDEVSTSCRDLGCVRFAIKESRGGPGKLQCESHCDDLDKARVTFQYYFPLIVNNLINLDDSIHTVYNILDRSSATFRRILTPIRKEGIRGQVRLSKL